MLSGWRVRVCAGRARNRVVSRSSTVFPQMVSDSFSRGSLVAQTNCCISSPGGRSQAVMRVVKLDVEVLGSRGFVGSAVVRPSNPLKRSSVPIQCQFHAVVLCSVIELHIVIGANPADTCGITTLSNGHADMTQRSGGFIILAKEKSSLKRISFSPKTPNLLLQLVKMGAKMCFIVFEYTLYFNPMF